MEQSQSLVAFIALGSNQGDSARLVREAIERLATFSEKPLLVSSLWDTTPVDCPLNSSRFVNAVLGLTPQAEETPQSLLEKLKSLEREFGRLPKKELNEARPIDLDLIAFGSQQISSPDLILPHPRAHLRRFVLAPLNEIAPNLILPGQTFSAAELLAQLVSDEIVRRIRPNHNGHSSII